MDKLNDVVPYGVACGNHDLMDGKKGELHQPQVRGLLRPA